MNKELKNVLSKTEPSNTNVVWYHPTEEGIIPKVFRGGWQALIQGAAGDTTQVIEWSHTHNMNDYKDAGTYRIKGERTGNPLSDNLPIMNSGSGHTIEGILYVLDSSLANGSGKESDCTITQFLMLSNRVGGQEGDMYMRSAYGANKDSLTWKPWEKYQTNMEVGALSDYKLLNPSNPTEILKHDSGMMHIRDNGIYSGIYFGPKCMVGTGEDDWHISFQDATAIETFVMVVINNYLAANDARCITQIKFAVTNGGVFSMEKRSTTPGNTDGWSQWKSVGGGGLPDYISFQESVNSKYYFGCKEPESIAIGSGVAIGQGVRIEEGVTITKESVMGGGNGLPAGVSISIPQEDNGFIIESEDSTLKLGSGIIEAIGPGVNTLISGNTRIGNGAKIGQNVNVGNYVSIGERASIGLNVIIPDNLKFSIADNILTITDGTKTWKLTAEA